VRLYDRLVILNVRTEPRLNLHALVLSYFRVTGAELAFCAFNKALMDAARPDASGIGDLDDMIPEFVVEDMKRVNMLRRINQEFELANKAWAPKRYAGCGGHKLLDMTLESINYLDLAQFGFESELGIFKVVVSLVCRQSVGRL
jgi:hypothetical protein